MNFNTKSALKDFADKNAMILSAQRCSVRNALCDMLAIHRETGHTWFVEGGLPIGKNLLKLGLFLELVGYNTEERASLSNETKELADGIALSTIDIGRDFPLFDSKVIYDWAFGKYKPHSGNRSVLLNVLNQKRMETLVVRRSWVTKILDLNLMLPAIKIHDSSADSSAVELSHDELIHALAQMIKSGIPLAERLLSDEFSAQERSSLIGATKSARSNGVFDFSNLLNRLCSERARNEIKPSKESKL